jgi:hypothetical protein
MEGWGDDETMDVERSSRASQPLVRHHPTVTATREEATGRRANARDVCPSLARAFGRARDDDARRD